MPTYNSNPFYVQKAIESVMNQTYKDVKLMIVDDGSTSSHHKDIINEMRQKWNTDDCKRIDLIYLKNNTGIANAITEGIKDDKNSFKSDYIGFLDHDDTLEPNCIESAITFMEANKQFGMAYTDEREMTKDGYPSSVICKEDYNADMHLSVMYLNHFQIYRQELLNEFLPLRFSGAQDYDLTLRFSEKYSIGHIREILYNWRRWENSSLDKMKTETIIANKQVIDDAVKRRNIDCKVVPGPEPTKWHMDRPLKVSDPVEIIIINKDKLHLLDACISSIENHTKYPYKITIVDTGSTDVRVLNLLKNTKHKVLHEPFNFSTNNNSAIEKSDCKYVCLLNNDIIVSEGWLTEMMKQLQRDNVGVVGSKLIFPNDTIQHAGLAYGIAGLAYHMFIGQNKNLWKVNIIREVNAVTGACLLVKKDIYEKAGRLNPDYMIEFQDVDLCLSIQKLGYKIIYTPYAELVHFTSISRGNPTSKQAINDRGIFTTKWRDVLVSAPDMNIPQNLIDPQNLKKVMYWIELGKKAKENNENRNRNTYIQPSG